MVDGPLLGVRTGGRMKPLGSAVEVIRCRRGRWTTRLSDRAGRRRRPAGARVFSVADAFDAMTSDRLPAKAIPFDQACQEIADGAGFQFDPMVVNVTAIVRSCLAYTRPCTRALDGAHARSPHASLAGGLRANRFPLGCPGGTLQVKVQKGGGRGGPGRGRAVRVVEDRPLGRGGDVAAPTGGCWPPPATPTWSSTSAPAPSRSRPWRCAPLRVEGRAELGRVALAGPAAPRPRQGRASARKSYLEAAGLDGRALRLRRPAGGGGGGGGGGVCGGWWWSGGGVAVDVMRWRVWWASSGRTKLLMQQAHRPPAASSPKTASRVTERRPTFLLLTVAACARSSLVCTIRQRKPIASRRRINPVLRLRRLATWAGVSGHERYWVGGGYYILLG